MTVLVVAGHLASCAEALKPEPTPSIYEKPAILTGTIYERNSRRVLFKFVRRAARHGTTVNVLREYTAPDGKLATREQVVYEGDRLVSYKLEDLQVDATGSATIRSDGQEPGTAQILFEYAKDDGKSEPRTEPLEEATLVNDMVGVFLVRHWDALMKGRKVKCRYIVVPRQETVGFKFVKEGESTWQGKPVVLIRMAPSSLFISALVEPLLFTVEKTGEHRVLQYVGRTVPKIKKGNSWKDLDAVTVFDWQEAGRTAMRPERESAASGKAGGLTQ